MKELTLIIAIVFSGMLVQAQSVTTTETTKPERIEYLENHIFVLTEMYDEVVNYEDNKVGEYNGCGTKRGIQVIVDKVEFDKIIYPSKADLILYADDEKIICTADGFHDLSNAERGWMDRVFEPGRILLIDFLQCGNRGYLSIGRVKVIR